MLVLTWGFGALLRPLQTVKICYQITSKFSEQTYFDAAKSNSAPLMGHNIKKCNCKS